MIDSVDSFLSIQHAANETPQKLALVTESQRWTFAELCQTIQTRTPSHSHSATVRVASPRLETLLEFYHCLLTKKTFIPLHAQYDSAMQHRLIQTLPKSVDSEIALILFTSGSTGLPKGVCLTRKSIVASANALAKKISWDDNDLWLCCLPLSHIGGIAIAIRCLVARKSLWLMEAFDADKVRHAIDDGVTMVSLVPTMLYQLLEDKTWRPPDHLRVVLLGGSQISNTLLAEATQRGLPVFTTYGMTESGSGIAVDGDPLDQVELRIDEFKRLFLRGPMFMRGYVGNTALENWFETGDIAENSSGLLKILGRADDMIISGGENISPFFIEEHLRGCQNIDDCLVVGLDHPKWGQIVGALIVSDSPELPQAVANHCMNLPAFAKPRRIARVKKLPIGASEKVSRQIDPSKWQWSDIQYPKSL